MAYTPYAVCYKSRGSQSVGGIFVFSDGSRRVIPDNWLYHAKQQNDATLIQLFYSFCIVEISGYRLENIFNDVTNGRLGIVTVAHPADALPDAGDREPFVTGIFHIPVAPVDAPELDSFDT